MNTVDTELIASAVMGWMRFGKQFHYVAREAGMFSSDVLGTNGKTIIEVEIKISMTDFKADWKKIKHLTYQEKKDKNVGSSQYIVGHKNRNRWRKHIPNQFYFACPASMKDFAVEQVRANAPEYGVIVMRENITGVYHGSMHKCLSVAKSAKVMHRRPPTEGLLTDIAARMSSDLINLRYQRRLSEDWVDIGLKASKSFMEARDIEEKVKLK